MSEPITIRSMQFADYREIFELWAQGDGIVLSSADSEEKIAAFLERNPNLSFVAMHNEKIVGTVLCGHDGRRGYIYHMYVVGAYRNQGIGSELVEKCLAALKEQNIHKCHLFVYNKNELGKQFWTKSGWMLRKDIVVMSKTIED